MLRRLAAVGALAGAYQATTGFSLLPRAAAAALPPGCETIGRGRKVAVLGAGVGGICAAYELERKGFDVTVFEASARPGGRSLTLRHGDSFQEESGPVQRCTFDGDRKDQWLNAGPGRIRSYDTAFLNYCRDLGVTMEPYIFNSRENLTTRATSVYNDGKKIGEVVQDLRGQIAAELDRCQKKPGSTPDATLTQMLAQFGGLTEPADKAQPWPYDNQEGRAGYVDPPGLLVPQPKPLTPLKLDELLKSDVWKDSVFRENYYIWQSSLLQPAGGMDMFWKAFLRQPLCSRPQARVESLIAFNAPAGGIAVGAKEVVVQIRGRGSFKFDFCVSNIPMPIFATLALPGLEKVKDAAGRIKVSASGKVGWQATRFWEEKDQIYGGISWVDGLADQVWYPSDGFFSKLGVLTGAYMSGGKAVAFNGKPVADRLEISRAAIERMHPGSGPLLKHGLAIGWEKMPTIKMAWVDTSDRDFVANASIVAPPQGPGAGRLFQVGDQLTWLSGWQEGALLTAQQAVAQIVKQVRSP
jgi:monoamine oxidase